MVFTALKLKKQTKRLKKIYYLLGRFHDSSTDHASNWILLRAYLATFLTCNHSKSHRLSNYISKYSEYFKIVLIKIYLPIYKCHLLFISRNKKWINNLDLPKKKVVDDWGQRENILLCTRYLRNVQCLVLSSKTKIPKKLRVSCRASM